MTDIHTLNAFVSVATDIPGITPAMADKEADALEAIRLLTRAYVDAVRPLTEKLDVSWAHVPNMDPDFFDVLIEFMDDELGLIPEAGAILWDRK
jgi:hypothetical protein